MRIFGDQRRSTRKLFTSSCVCGGMRTSLTKKKLFTDRLRVATASIQHLPAPIYPSTGVFKKNSTTTTTAGSLYIGGCLFRHGDRCHLPEGFLNFISTTLAPSGGGFILFHITFVVPEPLPFAWGEDCYFRYPSRFASGFILYYKLYLFLYPCTPSRFEFAL